MRKIQAVIFDLDGTLLDSLQDLATAMNRTLAERGYPTHSSDAYKIFVGDGMRNLVRRAAPPEASEDEALILSLVDEMKRCYAGLWHQASRPYPGITDLLVRLRNSALPLAVLSNKPHAFTSQVMGYFFGTTPWAGIEGARDDRPIKPAPDGALAIANLLGIDASHIAFVGDTSTDMKTAVNAGMIPIGVTWGFRDKAELREHGAQNIVQDAEALGNLLLST